MNLLFYGFEGSNEEKWVGNNARVSIVKYGETPFEELGLGGGGGACKNPVGFSVRDGPMETVE